MLKRLRILIVVVAVGIIAGVAALLWPKPCTPDTECVDYKNINNSINSTVNTAP